MSEPPRKLGPFEVVRKIGAGGMGEVFLARDPRLGRDVAIKVLPEDLTKDPDRRSRFLREARAAAVLNHPNITTIHEIGEADGRDYIAFELVDGKTLQEVVEERNLTMAELVDLALPLADALGYAHEQGVVHRDLKATNVMVTGRGLPKLLDFGLAKLKQDESQSPEKKKTTTLTMTGAVFGTPAAMSPEQAMGKPVDERSDVFSFGSLLYEMACGRPPFARESLIETVNAVIHQEPEDLGRLRKDLPADFLDIVSKALRKDPGERYQHMSDLGADLRHFKRSTESGLVPPGSAASPFSSRWLVAMVAIVIVAGGALLWIFSPGRTGRSEGADTSSAAAASLADRSVAILPFTTLSTSEEDRVFVSGLHDDVLTQVAKIGALRVISRTSVLEYADTQKSVPEIGAELGVVAVLEGGVQRSGDSVRINFKLIEAETEENLWAESYNRELTAENVFAIQSDVATEIARVLQATLSPEEAEQIAARPTENIEAYDYYLRGTVYLRGAEVWDFEKAREMFQRALDLDPDFALAHAKLGETISFHNWQGANDPAEQERARASVLRALELEPGLPEAHRVLGSLYYHERDYDRALEQYEIAARSIPNDTTFRLAEAALLRRTGQWENALEIFRQVIPLDPVNPNLRWELAITYVFMGRLDEADIECAKALELAPNYETVLVQRFLNSLGRRGDPPLSWLAELQARQDVEPFMRSLIWGICLVMGDYEEALSFLDANLEEDAHQWYWHPDPLLRAVTLELMGDPDGARSHYEAALAILEADPEPDMRTWSALGLVYAGLDRPDDALNAGRRAMDLIPYEKDSIVHSALQIEHAFAMVRAGEHERAVAELRGYLSKPSYYNIEYLLRDPRIEPLKELTSFQNLVEEERR